MEEANQQRDRITSSAGGKLVEPNLTEQPLSPKGGRIVSTNPSPGAAFMGPSRDITVQLDSSYSSGSLTALYPQEQTYYYGGFENTSGNWDDYSHYVNANGLQVVSPAMYNDNPSLVFHSGYGLDTQMPYGQFSPMASPLSPVMVDGQLYSPHQIPASPTYFPQPVPSSVPHVTSSLPISQSDPIALGSSSQEGLGDTVLFGPGSGYFVHFGSFGGGSLSGEPLPNRSSSLTGSYLSPLTPPAAYPQPIGVLGPYEHHAGQFQISQQQRPSRGFGLAESSSPKNYPHGGSYQSSNYITASIPHWGSASRFAPEKGGRRERDRDSIFVSMDSYGISSDRNRGPRASKPKGKNLTEESSSSANSKNGASISRIHPVLYNRPDFATNYDNAKFFIIKSFSEDNVHKSIKYSIWASTPLGNRKLEAAYQEAKDMKGHCPVFLFFSVNASGQFCGIAEMDGPVDFETDADYWQQDRWCGQFPVRWQIIKDVPNSRFRHILLENNENKPVTHSRDSQEVKLEHGIEMLQIFKDYDAETSILDDFNFYDERERALQEKKARQKVTSSTKNVSVADASVNQLSENFTKNVPAADASINQLSDNFAEALQLEDGKEVSRFE